MVNHSLWRFVIAALLCIATSTSAQGQVRGCEPCGAGDEVLLMDLRRATCSTDPARVASAVRVLRRSESGCFEGSSFDEFFAHFDPTIPTIFYTHGNRVEVNEVLPFGMRVYRRLTACRRACRPIRYVMVSWNSDQEPGVLNDVRTKAARTDSVSWQLAWVIDQLPVDAPIGLFGYSFGARISLGAAHLLAGGSLGHVRIEGQTGYAKRPIEGVMVAAALDSGWLGPNQRQGLAMQQIDRLLVTTNRRDPAMRYYRLLSRTRDPDALGYDGPTCLSSDYARRIQKVNITTAVGSSHNLNEYLKAPGFACEAWRRLSFEQRDDVLASRLNTGAPIGALQ